MSSLNSPEMLISRWMRPSVARGWIAQITRYSRRPSTRCGRDEGEAAFRALLNCDWVTLDIPGAGTTRKS